MKHIEEIQIAGTALLLCGAMFAVSAVAPKGESISKAVTNFTEAPETAAEAQAQAEAAAEDAGFTIYTQESNYDYDNYDDSGYDSSYDDTSYDDTSYDDTSSGEIQQDDPNPDTGDSGSIDGDASSDADTGNQDSSDVPDDSGITEDDPTQIIYPSDDSSYDDSGDSGDNSDSYDNYDNNDSPAPDDTGDQSWEQTEDRLE